MSWDWGFALRVVPALLPGIWTTVEVSLVATTLALGGGLVLALLRRSSTRPLAGLTAAGIEFVRSTPVLVQLYFVFYVLPAAGLTLSAFTTGVLVLGFHYATYTSEVYRAGITSVAREQWDAARALNFSPASTWIRIILPQAIPPMIPALANYANAMFKATPTLLAVTVVELLAQAQAVGGTYFRYLEPITLVGVFFLGMSYSVTISARLLERRLAPK